VRKTVALVMAIALAVPATATAEVTQQELAEANEKIRDVSARLDGQMEALDSLVYRQHFNEERMAALERQIADTDRQLALAEFIAKERALIMYITAGTAGAEAILSVEAIAEEGARIAYLDALAENDYDAVTELEYLQADRERLQEEIDQIVADQELGAAQLEVAAGEIFAELEIANAEYQVLFGQWQVEEAERQRQAEEERRRREAAAAAAAAAATGHTSSEGIPAYGRSCPMAGPNSFRNSWGEPRPGGRSHTGLDIVAAMGTPLVAIESGVVRHLNWHYAGGIGIYLYGDTGDVFYYAHMAGYGPGIEDGLRVWQGQVIGYNGDTGNAAVPHLHLAYQPGGGPLTNPYQLMVKLCR
jgi:murein DD-endopeptidase MepM/ murein hydrolase activator NlpD